MRNRKDDSQPLLPFDDTPAEAPSESLPQSHAETVRCPPSEEALAGLERLEAWLTDPRTGKASPLGQEALDALDKALVEGRNGWLLKAEDMLEALALRNGQHQGDDIPAGQQPGEGPDFQQAIEDLFDALHERVVGRRR